MSSISSRTFVFYCFLVCFLGVLGLNEQEKLEIAKRWKVRDDDLDLRKARLANLWKPKEWLHGQRLNAQDLAAIKSVNVNETRATSVPKINMESGIAEFLYDGDIVLTETQLAEVESNRRRRRQVSLGAPLWTNNTVYYYYSDGYFDGGNEADMRFIIETGLEMISRDTCIKFIEDSTAKNRIKIIDDRGCYSYLGMLGGEQVLSLSPGCLVYPKTPAHEFMHALGFIHTQSRTDRDHYVTIDTTYVQRGSEGNFQIDRYSKIYTPYDYGSAMHYDARSFVTVPNEYSVIPKDNDYLFTIGGPFVSFLDLQAINELYSCKSSCEKKKTASDCKNNGYPNPRRCNECLCPMGYGGSGCKGPMPSYTATENWSKNYSIYANGNGRYSTQTYWITAPKDKKIQVKIVKLSYAWCDYGCEENGIEFKTLSDPSETGPRVCCNEFVEEVYTSQGNLLPIIAYSFQTQIDVIFAFKYVS